VHDAEVTHCAEGKFRPLPTPISCQERGTAVSQPTLKLALPTPKISNVQGKQRAESTGIHGDPTWGWYAGIEAPLPACMGQMLAGKRSAKQRHKTYDLVHLKAV
jgi:hypothetical protein